MDFLWLRVPCFHRRRITGGRVAHQVLVQVNVMDIRRNKALRIIGQTLLVSLALAMMAGGWMVIGTG
jgi:TRAP-type C4-dicarboxylate transport system permease small subunit